MENPSRPSTSFPSLVFVHGRKKCSETFLTLFDGHYYTRSIPEMRGRKCYACAYGWLVMVSSDSSECFLWNPISMAKILLPPLDFTTIDICILTSSPSDSNCTVMFLGKKWKVPLFCIFCRPGDDRWIKQDLEHKNCFNSMIGAVCCEGKVYVLLDNDWMGILDVHQTSAVVEFFRICYPVRSCSFGIITTYLVESDGEVFLVHRSLKGIDVIQAFEVFKLKPSEMVWEKVRSLGDQIFLLGHSSSSISAANLGISESGYLYFFSPKDKNLYTFNVEQESMCVDLPCPNIVHELSSCYWFVPGINQLQMSNFARLETGSSVSQPSIPKITPKRRRNWKQALQ